MNLFKVLKISIGDCFAVFMRVKNMLYNIKMYQESLFYVVKHISLYCESQTCYLLNDNTGIDLHSDMQK